MRKYFFILVFLKISCFYSCVDTISIPESSDPGKILIECELSPPYNISAKLSTTGDLNGIFKPSFPKDADIRLYSSIDEEFVFIYNEEKKLYEVKNGRLRRGMKYTLNAYIKSDDRLATVIAQAVVPENVAIKNIETLSYVEQISLDGKKEVTSEIEITFPEMKDGTMFHQLSIQLRIARINPNNITSPLEYLPVKVNAVYSNIRVGGGAIHKMNHKDALLIDRSRLEDNKVILSVTTQEALPNSKHLISSIHASLLNVTESYYQYNFSKSKQIGIAGKTSVEPVISYTNIENGFGFFGAYNSKVDSFLIVR